MGDINALVAAIEGRAERLKGLGYRVRFELMDSGESVVLDATGDAVVVEPGGGEADTVLRLSQVDLEKLMAGKLSPMLAFSMGRLKVEGSKGVAMKLAGMLDED